MVEDTQKTVTIYAPATHYAAKKPGSEKAGFFKRIGPKVQRNEPCPCGSGAKFKSCCKSEIVLLKIAKDGYEQEMKEQQMAEAM